MGYNLPAFMYIVTALNGHKEGLDWRCDCPVSGHDNGKHLILTDKRGGKIEGHCMMGGNWRDALEERGLWDSPSGGERRTPSPRSPVLRASPQLPTLKWNDPIAEHIYCDIEGKAVAIKGRFGKDHKPPFAWRMPDQKTWSGLNGTKGEDLPLYEAFQVSRRQNDIVWFCEGEKAADACKQHGLLACAPWAGASGALPGAGAWKILAGRDVVIWPDNDEPGRLLAVKVRALLDTITARVRVISVPNLPLKGDAYDFFEAGRTPDELTKLLTEVRIEPWLEPTFAGWLTSFPDGVRISFDNVTYGKHSLDADVTTTHDRGTYRCRINLLSGSNRTDYRRSLEDVMERPKGYWTATLNKAVELVQIAVLDDDPSISLQDAPVATQARYIHRPLISEVGVSMLYGDGGSAKTYLAVALGRASCLGELLLGWSPVAVNVLYIDYEADAATLRARAEALGSAPENFEYWPGRGIPLSEQVVPLQRKVSRDKIGLLIIDSAVQACSGEPEKADVARVFFQSISQIGAPALVISHVTHEAVIKNRTPPPFGSRFWHNNCRLAWFVRKSQEPDSSVAHLGLFQDKSNNDRPSAPFGVRITFGDEMKIEQEELSEDFTDNLPLSARIRRLLGGGALSVTDLSKRCGKPENQIRARLNGMKDVMVVGQEGKIVLWGLRA